MNKQLKECLENKQQRDNMFPFLWMREESHEELAEEIDAIYNDGIREFCCESRPYEHFCEDRWWVDFQFILDYAKAKDMRVWLLDDKHFPSGYANGYINKHPELRMKLLRYEYRDFIGPCDMTSILAAEPDDELEDKLISISAWQKGKEFYSLKGEPIDLTDKIHDGMIEWSIPKGIWRVYYIFEGKKSVNDHNYYIDMLDKQSCEAMLHAVYEPHYERFKDYFGNTFRGFFSDEPAFKNSNGSYCHTVGFDGIFMPWRPDMPQRIGDALGIPAEKVKLYLGALWHDFPGIGEAVRCEYMEQVTKLYRDNFSKQLGDWCRERNVEYIGHIIEDMNAHQRLGNSAGHFFRALEGQDMSGIDIVLKQLMPYNREIDHSAPICAHRADPAFFQFTLPKLGASAAHIRPEFNNKAMCEVFGAFGWVEGVGRMKYIADLMLSSGINQFVPHAYSMRYPDPDCPPYFHLKGFNPQEYAFAMLIEYMQKTAHMLSGGVHKADVAVFYNAQAEWTGGKNHCCQDVCKNLSLGFVDFDIIPEDTLKTAKIKDGKLVINKETYGALVVPYGEILPDDVFDTLISLEKKGLTLVFENKLPVRTVSGRKYDFKAEAVQTKKIAEYVRNLGCYHITADKKCYGLRTYRVDKKNETVYSLFNEDKYVIDSFVTFEKMQNPVIYDIWNNKIYTPETDGNSVRIKLYPGQAVIMLCGEKIDAPAFDYNDKCNKTVKAEWTVSIKDAKAESFEFYEKTENLVRFNTPEREFYFCGTIRYEAEFTATGKEKYLDLGLVGEIATVTLNGVDCGTQIEKPYKFDISEAVCKGKNSIVVDVVNNPVYRYRHTDSISSYTQITPSGLLGPIKLG